MSAREHDAAGVKTLNPVNRPKTRAGRAAGGGGGPVAGHRDAVAHRPAADAAQQGVPLELVPLGFPASAPL